MGAGVRWPPYRLSGGPSKTLSTVPCGPGTDRRGVETLPARLEFTDEPDHLRDQVLLCC